jgi:lipopolysaccharide export system permease protein
MQNIRQLVVIIDSLKLGLNEQQSNYITILRKKYPGYSQLDSSASGQQAVQPVFRPAILLNFDRKDWYSITQAAKYNAVSMRDNLETNRQTLYGRSKLIHKHEIVLHKKYTFSIACFLLFFIGAPLGAIIRKGGLGMPAVVATLFFILFWVISFTGEKYTAEGVLPAWQGMWIAPVVLLPIGIFLTYKATTDAALLDLDTYNRIFSRFFRKRSTPGHEDSPAV